MIDQAFTAFNAYAEQNFKLFKGIGLQLSGWFNSRSFWGTLRSAPQGAMDVGINKKIWKDKGEIRLRAYAEDESVHIIVEDTGIGIATEDFDKLFMPFAQVDSSTTRTASGTGLGLPITKWLIEMHHGSIHFSSRLNEGSTFHVVLPVHQSNDQPLEIPLVQSTIS